jgi:hypothetical protein
MANGIEARQVTGIEAHGARPERAGSQRGEERLRAIDDLRRKFRRAAVAMSFMPGIELSRQLGLPDSGIAERLTCNARLSQRLYWSLVDSERVPDLSALPAVGALSITDSPEAFENACVLIDGALVLRGCGTVLPRDQVKALARRFGDARLKWLWVNRDIWAAGASPAQTAEAARRQPDSRRLLVNHLAEHVPEVAQWMGRDNPAPRRSRGPDAELVARLVDRLVHGGGGGQHVH